MPKSLQDLDKLSSTDIESRVSHLQSSTVRTAARPGMQPPPFLVLPIEIRDLIYWYLLAATPRKHTQILVVCRQTCIEGWRLLLKRPKAFESNACFGEWLTKVGPARHSEIASVGIIGDQGHVNRSGCLNERAILPRSPSGASSYLARGIRRLTGLKHLTLFYNHREGDLNGSNFERGESALHLRLLQESPDICYSLRSLTIHTDAISLKFLSRLSSLQAFRFTGFSRSDAEEAIEIFNSLHSLSNLEVIGPVPCSLYQRRKGYHGFTIHPNISGHILMQMNPLKAFRITEIHSYLHDPLAGEQLLIDDSLVTSLVERHAGTLERLTITTNRLLFNQVTDVLCNRLNQVSSLKWLTLAWPDIPSSVFAALPDTLQSLETAVSCNCANEQDPTTLKLSNNSDWRTNIDPRISIAVWEVCGLGVPYPQYKCLPTTLGLGPRRESKQYEYRPPRLWKCSKGSSQIRKVDHEEHVEGWDVVCSQGGWVAALLAPWAIARGGIKSWRSKTG